MTLRSVFHDFRTDDPKVHVEDEETVQKEARRQLGVVEWTAASTLIPHVAELLNIPLPGLLMRGWQKADEVADALRDSADSPDEDFGVALDESEKELSFDPEVEVKLNGAPAGSIKFTVVVPLQFKSVVVKIKNGQVTGVSAAECYAGGEVRLGDLTIVKLSTPMKIPLA